MKAKEFTELKGGYRCDGCGRVLKDRIGSGSRSPHKSAQLDAMYPDCTEPVCTISIRSKSKRNRAIAEFEPSLLSRISDFILKRMDEEFKGNPTYERMMEERMLKKG